MNKDEYISALKELIQFRVDLGDMLEKKNIAKVTRTMLSQVRLISQRIESSLEPESNESESVFVDCLNLASTPNDVYITTGQWLTRARELAPKEYEIVTTPEVHQKESFGFNK